MAYVTKGCKELKTTYVIDSPGFGVQMHLIPQGLLGVKSLVLRRNSTGIG